MKDLKAYITESLAAAHAALYELLEYEADNPHDLHWGLVHLTRSTINNLKVMLSDVRKIEGEIMNRNWQPAGSPDELRVGDHLKVDVGHYTLEFKSPISTNDGDITFEDGHTYIWSNQHKVSYRRETSGGAMRARNPITRIDNG